MVRSERRDFFAVTLANTARDLASSFGFITHCSASPVSAFAHSRDLSVQEKMLKDIPSSL